MDGPPSLLDVMTLLSPQSQSGDMELQSDLFLLRSSDNEFDYTELGYHIEVLSCVLMNIPQYVQIEKNAGKEKRSQGDSHFSSKLEIIKVLLDRLNGGIGTCFYLLLWWMILNVTGLYSRYSRRSSR